MTLVITVTEKDLRQLISMLKETTQNNHVDNTIPVDTTKLLHKKMTEVDLMHLMLDIVTLSQSDGSMKLVVSFDHL